MRSRNRRSGTAGGIGFIRTRRYRISPAALGISRARGSSGGTQQGETPRVWTFRSVKDPDVVALLQRTVIPFSEGARFPTVLAQAGARRAAWGWESPLGSGQSACPGKHTPSHALVGADVSVTRCMAEGAGNRSGGQLIRQRVCTTVTRSGA